MWLFVETLVLTTYTVNFLFFRVPSKDAISCDPQKSSSCTLPPDPTLWGRGWVILGFLSCLIRIWRSCPSLPLLARRRAACGLLLFILGLLLLLGQLPRFVDLLDVEPPWGLIGVVAKGARIEGKSIKIHARIE